MFIIFGMGCAGTENGGGEGGGAPRFVCSLIPPGRYSAGSAPMCMYVCEHFVCVWCGCVNVFFTSLPGGCLQPI